MARADLVIESIAAFQKIAKKKGPNQMRAHYLAALLLDGRNRDEEARFHFDRLTQGAPDSGNARAALWRLGWSDFRNERYAESEQRFAALADTTANRIDRLRPLYWQGRSLEALGQNEEAAALYASLAEEFPLSYYGWRARDRSAQIR